MNHHRLLSSSSSLLLLFFVTFFSRASAECDTTGSCLPDGEACEIGGTPCCETGSSCFGFTFYKKCQPEPLCLHEWFDCTSGTAGNIECCGDMECALGSSDQYECQHVSYHDEEESSPVDEPTDAVVVELPEANVVWSPEDEGYIYFANMTNAGAQDPSSSNYALAAKAYIKPDCTGPHLCIYVMAEPGIALSSSEAWFKDYAYSSATIPFVAPGLTFREENGVIIGWFGCVTVPFDQGADGKGIQIHANWGYMGSMSLGNTASTGKDDSLVSIEYPVCLKPAFVEEEESSSSVAETPVEAPTPVAAPVTAPTTTTNTEVTVSSLEQEGWTPLFNMFNAGNPDTKNSNYQLAGKAWYKYDCASRLICWLVVAENGFELSNTEAWFKDYGHGSSALEAVAPGITFQVTNKVRTGWTGCFFEPMGASGTIEVHANYGVAGSGKLGNTASTGKSNTLGGFVKIAYDHMCVGLAPTCAAAGVKCNGSTPCCNGLACPSTGNKVCPHK